MKKLTALFLTVIMVLSMIPAAALFSNAAVTTLVTGPSVFHSGGTETWKAASADGVHGDRIVTQFLIGYQPPNNNGLSLATIGEQVGYVAGKWDGATWIPASCTNGHFELTVTDLDGVVTTFKDITPGTLYTNGTDNHIFRMEVNEAKGDKEFTIQRGNTYTLKLDIYVGSELTYTTESSGYTWTAGTSAWEKEIYKDGKVVQSQYVPSVDPYEEPIEVDLYHSGFSIGNGTDFEAHASFGKNMLVAIPKDKIVSPDDLSDAIVRITMGDRVIESAIVSSVGDFPGFDDNNNNTGVACTQYRIAMDPFPAAGSYMGSTLEFLRSSDRKLMYTGTMNIFSTGNVDPDYDPSNYPRLTTIAPFTGSDEDGNKLSDWENYGGQSLLHISMNSLYMLKDLTYAATTVEVLFDGVSLSGVLSSVEELSVEADGSYTALLRLNVGVPAEGEHTVQITVHYDDSIMYESQELTVYYITSKSGIPGDVNGDGSVNAADRTALARAVAGWEGYEYALVTGDINGDGNVNAADRTYLARYLAAWDGYEL